MTSSHQAWRDELARFRFERAKFAKLAAQRRQDAIECRRRRDWLGAMRADDRAAEYRHTRDQYAEQARLAMARISAPEGPTVRSNQHITAKE